VVLVVNFAHDVVDDFLRAGTAQFVFHAAERYAA
jgi:hypothetical protein